MAANIGEAAVAEAAVAEAAVAEAAAAEERKRLYERHRDDLSKREISNAENHDKSILTYSAAGLGLSLGLLKDFIPIAQAQYSWALYGSWIFFALAMISVIVSYPLSQKVIRLQLDRAKRYYLDNTETAFNERTKWEFHADLLNQWVSPTTFILAIILTTLFVSTNLKGANMADKKTPTSIALDGITGMEMQKMAQQKVSVQKGVTGMPMQSITASQPVATTSSAQQPQSQSQQGGNSSQTKQSR
jgi:hypothetical protein